MRGRGTTPCNRRRESCPWSRWARRGPPPPAGPAPAAADLATAVELLRRVHGALHGGQAGRALELLRESAIVLDGPLAEEAQAARVSALCQLGREADARVAVDRFVAVWPGSPLAARLQEG